MQLRYFAGLALGLLLCFTVGSAASRFPDPAQDVKPGSAGGQQTAVLAGGCFWGVEAVFERLEGVSDVVSGFAGGQKSTAHYEVVSTGTTGHAESVKITYDPAKISYGQLLKVFFAVAHDPTQLNRQGPDEGPQYRSAIFYGTPDEKTVAEAYIHQLDEAKIFKRRIVTTVVPLDGFYPAEAYHQNFLDRNPTDAYIVYNDMPKLAQLKKDFPEMMKTKKK
jgi:peptide-methionine (S)-S-oxide reductase